MKLPYIWGIKLNAILLGLNGWVIWFLRLHCCYGSTSIMAARLHWPLKLNISQNNYEDNSFFKRPTTVFFLKIMQNSTFFDQIKWSLVLLINYYVLITTICNSFTNNISLAAGFGEIPHYFDEHHTEMEIPSYSVMEVNEVTNFNLTSKHLNSYLNIISGNNFENYSSSTKVFNYFWLKLWEGVKFN